MGHYMFKASYTVEGIKGILAEGGTARRAAVDELARSVGGRVEAAYWAFGTDDFVLIAELPDNTAAAALATRVSASGVAAISTTVLLTPEEIDAAARVQVVYAPPKG